MSINALKEAYIFVDIIESVDIKKRTNGISYVMGAVGYTKLERCHYHQKFEDLVHSFFA
jgi:hypothetical protein